MTSAPEPTASPATFETAPVQPAPGAPQAESASLPSRAMASAVPAPVEPLPTLIPSAMPEPKGQANPGRKAPLAFTTGTLELLNETTDRDLMLSSLDHPQAVIPSIAGHDPITCKATAAPRATALQPATASRNAAIPLRPCLPTASHRPIIISLAFYLLVVLLCLWLKYIGIPWSFLPIPAAAIPPIALYLRLLRT